VDVEAANEMEAREQVRHGLWLKPGEIIKSCYPARQQVKSLHDYSPDFIKRYGQPPKLMRIRRTSFGAFIKKHLIKKIAAIIAAIVALLAGLATIAQWFQSHQSIKPPEEELSNPVLRNDGENSPD